MNPLAWARDSIRQRGLVRTSKVAATVARDFFFDLRYGTDTRRMVDVKILDTNSENKTYAVRYQATKAGPFLKLLRTLQLPQEGVFVDFGSGKGRALLIAAQYGFTKVVGIEFSARLCAQARENVATFAKIASLHSLIEVIEQDASLLPIHPDMHVFYMYNPFEATVLSIVLENIRRSVAATPRRIWLIYNTPRHHKVIDQAGLFRENSFYEIGGTEFRVYAN